MDEEDPNDDLEAAADAEYERLNKRAETELEELRDMQSLVSNE